MAQLVDHTGLCVVVIDGTQSMQDRAWLCNNAYEAEAMQRWLKANHIQSTRMRLDEAVDKE